MGQWHGLVDAIDEADGALSFGERRPAQSQLTEWLLGRQVRKGKAEGLFLPTPYDLDERRLPTGERLKTKLATTHILSQEAARILHVVGSQDPRIAGAVAATEAHLRETCYAVQHCTVGECAASFIGYVRFLWGVLGDRAAPEITLRLRTLSQHREGGGRWKRFPTYYTLLVLSEIPLPAAYDELAYASSVWESSARTGPTDGMHLTRRRLLRDRLASRGLTKD